MLIPVRACVHACMRVCSSALYSRKEGKFLKGISLEQESCSKTERILCSFLVIPH